MSDARLTDTRLRDLYARALDTPDERKGCPEPEDMLALVRGEGDEGKRLETLDHVMACANCSREFELLRAIDRANADDASGGAGPETRVTPLRPRTSWRRYAPLAIAAMILVAVGVNLANRDGGRDVMRGEQTTVALVGPADEVPAGVPVEFAWRKHPDALRYELEVLDTTGNVTYAASTADTMATASGTTLPPGDYRWWVRASTRTGDQRASEMRRLRVLRQ